MHTSVVTGKDDRYAIHLKVYEVRNSSKYPYGIKAKFVMVDTVKNEVCLLVDNHEPFGFHSHSLSGEGRTVRNPLAVFDYMTALDLFQLEVERIVKNEEE